MHVYVCECACGRQTEDGGKEKEREEWMDLECKHRDIPAIKYLSSENHSPEEMVMI